MSVSDTFYRRSRCRWIPTSGCEIEETEKKIFSHVKVQLESRFVDIANGTNRIWTHIIRNDKYHIPIVMVHGFGGGSGIWAMNLEAISTKSSVYMLDILGFGRSSRPKFSRDPVTAENEFVESLEQWRCQMNLEKFILLGHSLGGYIVTAYALKYPDHLEHLVLIDPWGYALMPPDGLGSMPLRVRIFVTLAKPFNPLALLRAAGPLGPGLVKKYRGDLGNRFKSMMDENIMHEYIYHCNALPPSGEAAFNTLTESVAWARMPMLNRVKDIRPDVPMTMIYGADSWMEPSTGYEVKRRRPDSSVDVHIIQEASHHVYADQPDIVNSILSELCEAVNQGREPVYNRVGEVVETDDGQYGNLRLK